MMRTTVAWSLALLLLVSPAAQSGAYGQDVVVLVNGQPVSFDQPPVLSGGRVLVPLRGVFERMGASVGWDGKTGVVTAVRGDVQVVLRIGARQAFVSGQAVALDVPPIIVGARTLVPLRFVSEALGAEVSWSDTARIVSITAAQSTQSPSGGQGQQPGQPAGGGQGQQPGQPAGGDQGQQPGQPASGNQGQQPGQPASGDQGQPPGPPLSGDQGQPPSQPPSGGQSQQPGQPITGGQGQQPSQPPAPGPSQGPSSTSTGGQGQPSQPSGPPAPHIMIDRTVYHFYDSSIGPGGSNIGTTLYEVDVYVSNTGAADTFAVGISLEPPYPIGYVGTVNDFCTNLIHPYGNSSSANLPASAPPRLVLQVLGTRTGNWDSAPLGPYILRTGINDPTTAYYANPYLGPAGGYFYRIQSKDEATLYLPTDGSVKCWFNPAGLPPFARGQQQTTQTPQGPLQGPGLPTTGGKGQPGLSSGASPSIQIEKSVHQQVNGQRTIFWVDVSAVNTGNVNTSPFVAALNVSRGPSRVCSKSVNLYIPAAQPFRGPFVVKALRFQVTVPVVVLPFRPLPPGVVLAPYGLDASININAQGNHDVATLSLPASGTMECVALVGSLQ